VAVLHEAMGLQLWHRSDLQWYYLPAEFHENLPIGSKVIGGNILKNWPFHKSSFHFLKKRWLKKASYEEQSKPG
jgi:hypothetical protein